MPRRKFTGRDIGAELLPILTSGLYRDPFDAVREYTQNGIDAGAKEIKIIVASNSLTIVDYGDGMSREVADGAIRLGISDKDPRKQVGFRGIGIYSALHLCDELLIRTRDKNGVCSSISCKFKLVRDLILEQERGRLNGKKMTLWLEGVMEQAVTVDTDKNSPLDRSGTAVFLKGLSTDMGDRLKNQEKLEQYLQDTIPVPFNPDFKWGRFIQSELDKRKYHSIKVELSHGGKKYNIYRPYVNDIFSNKSGEEPAFIEVKNPDSHDVFGFCWYCVNDSNNVIPKNYERIRSLVVKKFGFSVGQRTYTQKFFNRKVISDRITGEIIITNQKLLPNAARDDFEAGPIRDSYHLAIYSLVSTVTEHVDRLQTERKALDVLDEAKLVITKLFESIPMSSGDVEKLLDLKSRLEIYEDRKLKPQRAWLKKNRANDIRQLDELIKNVKSKITELIQTKKEKRTGKVIEVLEKISKKAPRGTTRKQTPSPKCLLDVVDQLGLTVSQTMQDFLNAVDAKIIKPNFQEDEYILALADLFEEMEDVL